MGKIPENKINNFKITCNSAGACQLTENGFLWMTNNSKEIKTHTFAVDRCSGTILVGGLGLGVVVEMLAKKEDVDRIVVVEKAQEVIDLVWPYVETHNKGEIVCSDLFDYLQDIPEVFDYMYFDVWEDVTIEDYIKVVLPLRELAEKYLPSDKILGWQEEYMLKIIKRGE
jgi:spermidine synthase